MGCATTSDGLLLEEVRSPLIRDAESGRGASYCYFKFLKVFTGRIYRIRAIELQGFSKGNFQRFQQLLASGFLAVDARNFLDPAIPAVALGLYHRCVSSIHGASVARFFPDT